MPLATTFAGDSARAEGLFNIISLGAGYWAATLTDAGSTPNTVGRGIATDSSGNVYVCGDGLNSSSGRVASVSKYNSSGTILWQRTITDAYSTPSSFAYGITVDSSGNVYVCGKGLNASNYNNATVSKYDSSGTIQWQQTFYETSSSISFFYGISIDSSNNVYVCGSFNGTSINSIYKLNSSGIVQWQRSLDDGRTPKIKIVGFYGITIDSSANLYVCGSNLDSSDNGLITICKYNSSGTIQWQRSLTSAGSAPYGAGNGIAVDSSANVYVAAQGYNSSNQVIASISKWNSSGTLQWQRTLTDAGSTINTTSTGVSIDSSGNVFVVGFGQNSSNQQVISISKWDSSGTIQFQRTITDTYSTPNDRGNGITVDSLGNMYVTGWIKNTANQTVVFIAKLPSDGSRTGTYSNSTFGIVYASSSWTAATSTWTAATSTYTSDTTGLSGNASSWTNATSTWSTSLIVV
jgi:hypothetical protein